METQTLGEIDSRCRIAKLDPNDETMTPAKSAFKSGNFVQALTLTQVACETHTAKGITAPSKEADKKDEKGEKIKQPDFTKAPDESWRDLSPKEQIKLGMAKSREK